MGKGQEMMTRLLKEERTAVGKKFKLVQGSV
jgi:hypothetical protein